MKHLRRFNEGLDKSQRKELSIRGRSRITPLKLGVYSVFNNLVVSSDSEKKVISFQTSEKGVDISDISKIEDLIQFLMDERDKLL